MSAICRVGTQIAFISDTITVQLRCRIADSPFSACVSGVGSMNRGPNRLVNRRQILQAGAIGYLGLSLPRLLRAEATRSAASADSCILVFVNGGPRFIRIMYKKRVVDMVMG